VEIENAKKEAVDLGVQISELSRANTVAQNALISLKKDLDKRDTIIQSLEERIKQIQTVNPIEKITGWELMVLGWKKFWRGDK
jgi:CII-binding regulator of phage lambda lysogenization HflD